MPSRDIVSCTKRLPNKLPGGDAQVTSSAASVATASLVRPSCIAMVVMRGTPSRAAAPTGACSPSRTHRAPPTTAGTST
eukprot:6567008-Prymnesium_polylepis.2